VEDAADEGIYEEDDMSSTMPPGLKYKPNSKKAGALGKRFFNTERHKVAYSEDPSDNLIEYHNPRLNDLLGKSVAAAVMQTDEGHMVYTVMAPDTQLVTNALGNSNMRNTRTSDGWKEIYINHGGRIPDEEAKQMAINAFNIVFSALMDQLAVNKLASGTKPNDEPSDQSDGMWSGFDDSEEYDPRSDIWHDQEDHMSDPNLEFDDEDEEGRY
jgi:hypothetical protein